MFERFKNYHIAVRLQKACDILMIEWHAGKAEDAHRFALQLTATHLAGFSANICDHEN